MKVAGPVGAKVFGRVYVPRAKGDEKVKIRG